MDGEIESTTEESFNLVLGDNFDIGHANHTSNNENFKGKLAFLIFSRIGYDGSNYTEFINNYIYDDLIADWSYSSDNEDVLYDHSGNGIHGIISGASWVLNSLSGDLNSDGLINVLDVVVLVNIVLGYGDPVDVGDMNDDDVLNVLDIVMLVDIILEI